ncbi:hypothetical protein Tco_0906839 [Tanacetum coccineum]|uniref:Uncharacterized protein n=1 Tax=Tanacetum coccineum TaxID=301880 RepID=A0ABQ5CNU1_9ASTR
MYGFKECSSCGALYNRERFCSNVNSVDKFVRDPNKTPDSSQLPPHNCPNCGNPIDGLYCRQCALLRKKLEEVWFTICDENENFQDFLNTSESSNDNTNVVDAPQEPFVFNQDPEKQHQPKDIQELLRKLLNDMQIMLADYINTPNWNRPAFYNNDDEDDDEEYTIAITPVLPTVEPDNSLSMGDEHLSSIPEKEESSVEDLVPIPSESEGISDSMCDVPFCNNSTPLEASKDHSKILLDSNDDYSSSDDDSLYSEDINYVDASPPDSELVSLEEVKDFDPEDGEIDTDILLTFKDDILHEKLLNINLLIAKIEALKDNPTPSSDFVTKYPSTSPNSFLEETNNFYNSLPESETLCFNLEEKSSGNPTSYTNLSLPDYEAFFCDSEPDSGDFTMDVAEDIFDNPTREPRVNVPNVLPTHPTLHLDSDFTLSSDSLGSDLVVSFPSGTRNKIFDPGIFIGVQSKRFLSPDEFSISFIRDPPFPVIDTLLPFSSENEDKVVNPGILAAGEEKSPHLLSHRGFKAFQLISESPMMIYGGDIPNLDVPFLHFYPP